MSRDAAAARLLERVMTDAAFRARFRADPEGAAREAGLDPTGDPSMETLELRESRSSLAGAMMAAAVEAVGVYDFLDQHVANASAPSHVAAAQAAASQPIAEPETDDAPDEDDDAAPGQVDQDDESDDEDEDEDEDEEDEDEEEPDEEEPDEEEPDEVGPDQDDLTDDEVVEGDDSDGDSSDGDSDDESDDDSDDGSSDGDDNDDSSGGDDSDDSDDSSGGEEPDLGGVGSDYPGDDAPQEKLAAWMGAEAKRRGLPPELPVMAALVESGLQNLPGGDADSVGFFQMRVSIWDQGEYAGYADEPEKQLDWFLDHAAAVRDQRIARGLSVKDADHYGEWIADVERPADQYRGRYQLRLEDARDLLRKGAALVEDATPSTPRAGAQAKEALQEAMRYLGTPYQWGGSTPQTGFDCSGLVQWAYAKAGIRIPRVTDQQFEAAGATKVSRKNLLPGDLVFFRDSTGYIHHVGMSLGGDRFVNAPHTGDVVKISSLKEPYWAKEFAGGRRFDPARAVDAADSPRAHAAESTNAFTALERDAAEVHRPGTALHRAIEMQEAHKRNYARVMPAITPDQIKRT